MSLGLNRIALALVTLALAGVATPALATDPYAVAPPYGRPVLPGTAIFPIVTTGQQIPLTGAAPGTSFRFLGIPDGLGAYSTGPGQLRMFVNHEFNPTSSVPAGPLSAGARITELNIGFGPGSATVLSGRDAIQNVYAGEPPVLRAPGTSAFARFCSGYLGGPWSGLDQPIYFCGEETGGAATFDGQGGSAVALVNGDLFQLPRVGHASWENVIVLPGTGSKTALLGGEDAGALTSQVYMYVGDKQPGAASVLSRNGLDNGQLFVMAWVDTTRRNEATFTVKGSSVPVRWAQVNYNQNDAGLEAQAQAVGSFNLVRVEDLAYDKRFPGVAYFTTTGTPGSANPYGRLYRLTYDPANPTANGSLTLLLDGSEGIVSPDNIDINSAGDIMLCEDPNYDLSLPPINSTRDTYLWRYQTGTGVVTPVLEMDRPNAISHALSADPLNTNVAASNKPGFWEFSGIIDASAWTGPNTWILDVQAHSLRINPSSATVEGGQLMLIQLDSPTPIEDDLGFEGHNVGDDGVRLSWSVVDRRTLDGFRLERASRADGPWTALHADLLSSAVSNFTDRPGAGTWWYRVHSVRAGSIVATSEVFNTRVGDPENGSFTVSFAPVSPNPSSGTVHMRFRLPSTLAGSNVDLSVFDVGGRRVATLVHGTVSPGEVEATWSGRDSGGRELHGLFFARLQTPEGVIVRRIVRAE